MLASPEFGLEKIMQIFRYCLAAVFLTWFLYCLAMLIIYEPIEQVLDRTGVALVADIVEINHNREIPYQRVLTLKSRPVKAIFGESVKTSNVYCRYAEYQPHQRGEMVVSLLASGSGIEFKVKRGERVILLIESIDVHACALLRIETLKNEALIQIVKRL